MTIALSLSGDRVNVAVSGERHPRIFLDQCALYEFARRSALRARLLAAFGRKGELLFSIIGVLEAASLRGDSARELSTLLRDVGLNWLPIEIDVEKVVHAENRPRLPDESHPVIAEYLLERAVQLAAGAPPTLDRVVEYFASGDLEKHLADLKSAKEAVGRHVAEWQRLTPEQLDRTFPLVENRGATLRLLSRLVRAIVREGKAYRWTANDAFDLSHAIVPVSYADGVVLDRQWKEKLDRLQLGPEYAKTFHVGQIAAFLDWFENFAPS